MRNYYTSKEFAEKLGVTEQWALRKYGILVGEPPEPGRRDWIIYKDKADEVIAQHKANPPKRGPKPRGTTRREGEE